MSRIKPKRSNVAAKVPTTSDLEVGEIAVNMADRKIFVHEPGGTIVDLTEKADLTGYATETYADTAEADAVAAANTYTDTAVAGIVNSAPATLDTLNELAAALGDDPNFATTVSTQIGTKWTEDAAKIANWDTAYTWGDHSAAGYLTAHQDISGKADTTYVDAQLALKADAATTYTKTEVDALIPTVPPAYGDSEVNAHLNQSTAGPNQMLIWTGGDYDWIDQPTGGGGGTSDQFLEGGHSATVYSIDDLVIDAGGSV